MKIEITEEEARLIRRALCDSQLKHLSRAIETKEELKKLGRNDTYLADIEMDIHNKYTDLIKLIDDTMDINEI